MSDNRREIYKEERIQRKRARVKGRKQRKKVLLVIAVILIFAGLATMCGKDIVKLKSENIALQKQQKQLEEERDRLKEEVKKSGNREYVQEQARKQLRLLNPGELLFTFDEEEPEETEDKEKTEKTEKSDKSEKSEDSEKAEDAEKSEVQGDG